jgi:hypothetical protein
LVFIAINGCVSKETSEREAIKKDFEQINTMYNFDGLSVNARFAECGEFGGHRESIRLDASGDSIKCIYNIFPFNCDSLGYYAAKGDSILPISTRLKFIEQKDLNALKKYIEELSRSWTVRQNVSNGGEEYSVTGGDSSLLIKVYGDGEQNRENYKKLLSVLFQ